MIVLTGTTPVEVPEPTTPTRPTRAETRLRLLFTGADGSTWDLSSTRNPVYARQGISGFLPGDVEHFWSESPTLPGASHRGYRVPVQDFTLPVWVQGTPGLGFRDVDRMLWQALSPESECTLTVTSPDAEARTLSLWFVGVGDMDLESDPLMWGRAEYPLGFTAADPFWRGTTVTTTFQPNPDPPTLFEPRGAVENLIPDNTTGVGTIRNDGDVPGFAEYAVGPCEAFVVGLPGGGRVVAGGPVNEGEVIWIDTHPNRGTVGFARGENDEAAWLRLTERNFAAIPPGGAVELVTTVTGAGDPVQFEADAEPGNLLVSLTPRYRRPW